MNNKGLIITVISVGIALAGLITGLHSSLRTDIRAIQSDVADLRERMARLEGLMEGYTRRRPES